MTARRGTGTPARWVEKCTCPQGYVGQHCEKCDLGYRRSRPELGRFSSCEPCNCNGHSDTCDPVTGLPSQLTYLYCIAIVLIYHLLICSQETQAGRIHPNSTIYILNCSNNQSSTSVTFGFDVCIMLPSCGDVWYYNVSLFCTCRNV